MFVSERLRFFYTARSNRSDAHARQECRWLNKGKWCDSCRAKYAKANHVSDTEVAGLKLCKQKPDNVSRSNG